ncbi:hypothetical protein N658DRAFT_196926 [Parathielavia hyrcaniae]|uniref:Uncharacterized protein n=1 Tax=Parathielavia hyrcaniae TaxID=113614 RepID=A0AAN6Q7J6_9PEZI|nr:hypothetical protein N658DRAFT_196926 [Parathielavia hyrcaniae]
MPVVCCGFGGKMGKIAQAVLCLCWFVVGKFAPALFRNSTTGLAGDGVDVLSEVHRTTYPPAHELPTLLVESRERMRAPGRRYRVSGDGSGDGLESGNESRREAVAPRTWTNARRKWETFSPGNRHARHQSPCHTGFPTYCPTQRVWLRRSIGEVNS